MSFLRYQVIIFSIITQNHLHRLPAKHCETFRNVLLFRIDFCETNIENISSCFLAVQRGGIYESISSLHHCQL